MLHQGSWQDLLLPPRPRDFPHLLQPTGSSGDRQRRTLGSALQWPTPRIWQFPCQGEIAFREGNVFFFARKNHSSVNVAATPSCLQLNKNQSPSPRRVGRGWGGVLGMGKCSGFPKTCHLKAAKRGRSSGGCSENTKGPPCPGHQTSPVCYTVLLWAETPKARNVPPNRTTRP